MLPGRLAARRALGEAIGLVSVTGVRFTSAARPSGVSSRVANSPALTVRKPRRINSRPTADHWGRVSSRPIP